MLSPKRTKYRKSHRPKFKGYAKKGTKLGFGEFGLQALESSWLTSRQIEAGRRAMTRYARRGGKLWIRIFPDRPVTFRPADTRMGSGKGILEHWIAVIEPGKVLYELQGIPETVARSAMIIAGQKMPMKTRILSRQDTQRNKIKLNQNRHVYTIMRLPLCG